ncbi:predicted protein [Lichtheimia corymbifera JMRC:FSU:9682]|uniref:Heterokaryon incompatibility domain-containing protein n=1 Tax=Lichtheimia corymbifera JMRC:FSU:9682 TaxID=1263082 RepID=A0A068RE15_9FUNG|nr:predicted protein [Lichtheimia corymbifera JMRC:FSU:9682]
MRIITNQQHNVARMMEEIEYVLGLCFMSRRCLLTRIDFSDGDRKVENTTLNYWIEINEDNKYKQFFEKGLGALLSNPNFLLLYVPKNGAKMQVIRPARDSYHRNRMIRRINEAEGIPSFYYALSHLWGITENDRYYWNDISEYVNDEDGQPAKPVSMRPEKRDTLLALLKDHPDSYWWIDVLCARTDTPLDIMGDIYAYCLECIAMIDCVPGPISQLHLMADLKVEDIQCSDDSSVVRQFYDQCFDLADSLDTLIQSRWWSRVWTWQEMTLPFGEVRLMAETGTHRPLSNTITIDDLVRNYSVMWEVTVRIGNSLLYEREGIIGRDNDVEKMLRNFSKWRVTTRDWYQETYYARVYNKNRIQVEIKWLNLSSLLRTWGNSPRRCMDPVDYVYGVLGILQFEIPRMDDPDAVWKLFLSEMDKHLGSVHERFPLTRRISDRAYQVDLRKAQDMRDVYRDLEYIP